MNDFMNEDVMWERLKDRQLEAENSRLIEAGSATPGRGRVRLLGALIRDFAWGFQRGLAPRWWVQRP